MDDLAMAYSPGVARVCTAIAEKPELSHEYTIRKNTVAVVSDGTAVLGLGDIGPHAAMPVMEGKAQLFKRFGGVDAFPICLATKDPDEIVAVVTALAPTFGGINPVSYTHLDVYKRQPYDLSAIPAPARDAEE